MKRWEEAEVNWTSASRFGVGGRRRSRRVGSGSGNYHGAGERAIYFLIALLHLCLSALLAVTVVEGWPLGDREADFMHVRAIDVGISLAG